MQNIEERRLGRASLKVVSRQNLNLSHDWGAIFAHALNYRFGMFHPVTFSL